ARNLKLQTEALQFLRPSMKRFKLKSREPSSESEVDSTTLGGAKFRIPIDISHTSDSNILLEPNMISGEAEVVPSSDTFINEPWPGLPCFIVPDREKILDEDQSLDKDWKLAEALRAKADNVEEDVWDRAEIDKAHNFGQSIPPPSTYAIRSV
ncbi:rbcL, partial [Symbiodinium sp. KB8]